MDKRINVKTLAAVIGGSAVVAMAGLGIALGQASSDTSDTLASGKMNVGATSTETTPSTVPIVAKAQPTIKGPAPFKAK
jgi:hypothetical protein